MAHESVYLSRINAMIVDPNPFARRLLTTTLHAFGCKRWTECSDGAEALKVLRHTVPDIIFTELQMAPLDGEELVQFLRRDEKQAIQFMPVVVVTAYSEAYRVIGARDAGANEFLVKPYSAASLLARIREVVEKPRQFVRIDGYFGPDRRRRSGVTRAVLRRETDNHKEVLSQGAVDTLFAGGEVEDYGSESAGVIAAQHAMDQQKRRHTEEQAVAVNA